MQETREQILNILKKSGEATVDDIVCALRELRGDKITAVTVRHHLNELLKGELIATPHLRHRSTPGRPQHVYELTDKAQEFFPDNYQRLAAGLLTQMQKHVSPEGINVIMEGLAADMAVEAKINAHTLPKRLDQVVAYLNNNGYNATWEASTEHEGNYILYTHNCPYHHLAHETDALCGMDMRLISSMLGVVPRMLSRVSDGDTTCAYLIPVESSIADEKS